MKYVGRMSDMPNRDENNEIRCIAAEIICRLYKAKDRSQLEMLKVQCERSIEELDKEEHNGSD